MEVQIEKLIPKKLRYPEFQVFEINFFSVFNLMQLFAKYLVGKNLKGSIVNLGSIVGQTGFSELAGYASTKSALVGLTKSFAVEMAKKKNSKKLHIFVIVIKPLFIKTLNHR